LIKIECISKQKLIFYKVIHKLFYILIQLYHKSRAYIISSQFKTIGNETRLDENIWINKGENISIGSHTFIGRNVYLNAFDTIEIGDYCAIAADVKFMTANHGYSDNDKPIKLQSYTYSSIKIHNNVWIGYNCIILPGVTIEEGCVIAAGSVVTKSFEKNSIIAGVPARLIKKR